MKTLLLMGLCMMLGTMNAGAAQLVWDAVPGNAQAEDGSGTWINSAANTNWWNQTQNVSWPNTSADTAVFGANNGTAGVVTVSGAVTAGGLVFTNAGSGTYVLGGGTIGLAGANPEINTFTNAMIRSDIAGTVGLVKTAAGKLTLDGAKSYTGATVVSAGSLAVAGTPTLPVTNGLLVWFDADDATTITMDSSNRVSAWASKGSYTGSASASGTDRPTFAYDVLNGRSTIRFDDTQANGMINVGALTAANFAESNASLFVVWTLNNDDAYGVVSTANAGSEWWRYYGGSSYLSLFRSDRLWAYSIMPSNGTHMLELTTSASNNSWKVWKDGSLWAQTTLNWYLDTTLQLGFDGSWDHLNGDIAEVLIYTNALSDADRQKVEAYLNAKWLGVGSSSSSAGNMLPTNTAVQVAAGATLDLSQYADQTIASLADSGGSGGAVVLGSQTLTVGDASSTTFSGNLSGAGGLTKTGAGIQTLMGTNTYIGATVINAGTLELSHPDNLLGNITNNGNLVFNLADTNAYPGSVSGGGGLGKKGSGALSFAADQTYTGATVISAGTLRLGVPGAPMSGNLLVWFDAADASTITRDSSNRVSAWASKGTYTGSAGASGVSRPTYTTGALNGKSVIRFDDTQPNFMTNGGVLTTANFANSNASLFVVWTLNNDDMYGVVDTDWTQSGYWRYSGTTTPFWSLFRKDRYNAGLAMPTTGSHMLELTTSTTGNTYKILVDGANFAAGLTPNWGISSTLQLGYSIPGAVYLNGDIAEVLIYNTALSDADRLKVHAYLDAKWQLGLTTRGGGIALTGSKQLTVTSGATLDLSGSTNAMLNTNALLRLNGVINLEAASTQTVWRLNLGDSAAATGTWGGTGSGAAHVNATYFHGTGILKVSETIASGSIMSFK